MLSKTIFLLLLISSLLYSQQLEELRAVKLTDIDSQVLTETKIAEAMDYLASIGVNAVLPVVLNGGYTQFPSDVMVKYFGESYRLDPQFKGYDPLEKVITEAHRNGIEVYPWFEYGFASFYSGGTAPFGGHILEKYPDWACRNIDGKITTENGFDWMSGINPEVQNFMIELVMEVIRKYDIDGIEFSDRMPALPVKGGYDSVTVEIYKAEHNGNNSPNNNQDASWKRWRADKLNQFYRNVRDSVKLYDPNLFVDSSPSVYPWGYDNYLQDSYTWLNSNIVDHLIPQLYRYNINDYNYELGRALSYSKSENKHKIIAGILMNVGSYIISPLFLTQSLQSNRDNGLKGEAYFFYEGLRKNNNQLGELVKTQFYTNKALVPSRGGLERRPLPNIMNEDNVSVTLTGNWQQSVIPGFQGGMFYTQDISQFTSAVYTFDIQNTAYYDIFIFNTPVITKSTDSAHYRINNGDEIKEFYINQEIQKNKGWIKLTTELLNSGTLDLLTIDNEKLKLGKNLQTDAVMIMINRKLSPDVVISVEDENIEVAIPSDFILFNNYPNPFNPATNISFQLSETGKVELAIYDILGRHIQTLINADYSAGKYNVMFNAEDLPSGIYFYQLKVNNKQVTKKMSLVK